eukprot:1142665-Pelagomonas_calceolata.AAC.3
MHSRQRHSGTCAAGALEACAEMLDTRHASSPLMQGSSDEERHKRTNSRLQQSFAKLGGRPIPKCDAIPRCNA